MTRDFLAINIFPKDNFGAERTACPAHFQLDPSRAWTALAERFVAMAESPSDAEADARGVERRLRPTNWRQIKLGTGTTNLSHTHPVLVAAQAAMLDHLLKGRFLFGVSPGALESAQAFERVPLMGSAARAGPRLHHSGGRWRENPES